jgi:GDP-L-fucose synthase
MGWRASIPLEEGIRATYEDFLAREATPAPRAVAA